MCLKHSLQLIKFIPFHVHATTSHKFFIWQTFHQFYQRLLLRVILYQERPPYVVLLLTKAAHCQFHYCYQVLIAVLQSVTVLLTERFHKLKTSHESTVNNRSLGTTWISIITIRLSLSLQKRWVRLHHLIPKRQQVSSLGVGNKLSLMMKQLEPFKVVLTMVYWKVMWLKEEVVKFQSKKKKWPRVDNIRYIV